MMTVRIRLRALTAALPLWATLAGCSTAKIGDVRIVEAEKSTDGTGIVALRVRYRDREEPFMLQEDYAFLIDWDFDPVQRRFYVYERPRRRVQVTSGYGAFLDCVRALPARCSVAWLNTCCAPISCGMTDEDRGRLDAAMAAGQKTCVPLDDEKGESNHLIICRCESIGLRFPE